MYSCSIRLLFLYSQQAEKHIVWSCTSAVWTRLKNSIYCTSTVEMHSTCRKDPNSTESVEEAALKASGPMPCALLIVTSAFLSSNSDWWVRRGGGVFFRGDGERLVVKNSVLKSHLSCQRADTGHPGTWGLWCSESGHWPSFPPTQPASPPPTTSHLQNTPQPPHLICSLLSSWPQWTALLLQHLFSIPSLRPVLLFFLLSLFLGNPVNIWNVKSHLEHRNKSFSYCKQ